MGDYLTRWINDSIGMEARLTVLGHVQRGGSPTVQDRIMAYKFAVAAVDALDAGQKNSIMVFRDGNYDHLPINAVTDSKYQLDPAIIRLSSPLAC
jgi:6-phosphofructokinase 1